MTKDTSSGLRRTARRAKARAAASGGAVDGKWLEELVATVEIAALPAGYTVTVNRKVADEEGDQLAEFDIYIEGRTGTTVFRYLMECRDRPSGKSAPASWIEQLVGRRTLHDLHQIVAVSSTPFGAPALKQARKGNIETRTVSDMTAERIAEWLTRPKLSIVFPQFKIIHTVLQFRGTPREVFEPNVQRIVGTSFHEKHFWVEELGAYMSADDFAKWCYDQDPSPWADLNEGEEKKYQFPMYFDDTMSVYLDGPSGRLRMTGLGIKSILSVSRTEVLFGDPKEYRRGKKGELIARSATARYDDGARAVSFIYHQLQDDQSEHLFFKQTRGPTSAIPVGLTTRRGEDPRASSEEQAAERARTMRKPAL